MHDYLLDRVGVTGPIIFNFCVFHTKLIQSHTKNYKIH